MVAAYLPLLAGALIALAGPRLTTGARPTVGVWALSIGLGAATLGAVWSLILLAGSIVDGHPIGGAALAWLGVAGFRAARATRARISLHRTLRAACPTPDDGDVVVLDDPTPHAFALPGGVGRIVVTTGMLAALDEAERRVLLAHERAHLTARHDWHRALAVVAVAVNPLLRPCREALAYLCERCADELAGSEVGDRGLAARALARAALATHTHLTGGALAFGEYGVSRRVRALSEPPLPRRTAILLVALLVSLAILASEVDATSLLW